MATHTPTRSQFEPFAPTSAGGKPAARAYVQQDAAGRRVRIAALLALVVGAYGLIARDVVIGVGISQPIVASNNIFFRLYALHEAPFLWLMVLTGAATWVAAYRAPLRGSPEWTKAAVARIARIPAWAAAIAVLTLTAIGTVVVMHGIGLSMDEHAASFQARIFASGQIQATVPTEWRALAPWMTPVFVNYKPIDGVWVASYLPVYAAMRALFSLASAEWLTNSVLAAASVVLLAAVTRRLWLGGRRVRAGGLALLFLLLSSQFLVTSMSGYSMPAHLCLNLLWLWLYLRDDRPSMALVPWVGVLALGLHNPVPHALFAAPFLLRVLRDRRYGWMAYCGAVYLAGAIGWYEWLGFVHTGIGAPDAATAADPNVVGGFLTNFSLPGLFSWFVQGMSLALFFTWQTPVLAIFLPVGLMAWRRLGPVERDLAVGLAAAWCFYALVSANQGHGWGYRYLYPVLGNAVLLAARGADEVWRSGREALVGRLVLASAVVTILVQWPLRAMQTESFVRPYAAALAVIASDPAQVVAVDPASAWYGRDLVRNDPLFRATPKVIGLGPVRGRRPDPRLLPASVQRQVHALTAAELARIGLPIFQQTRR
ncbi:MAG TPA: hypothetical protein VNA20_06575 [Frankiaceae bacterium]|nr:hypothetical protein [Frankiaceae bacterium]